VLRFVLRRQLGFESACATIAFTDGADQAEYQRSIAHDEHESLVYDSVWQNIAH
jgi:hypothetical protein